MQQITTSQIENPAAASEVCSVCIARSLQPAISPRNAGGVGGCKVESPSRTSWPKGHPSRAHLTHDEGMAMAGKGAQKGDLVLAIVEYVGVEVQVKRRRGTPMLQLEADFRRNGEGKRPRVSSGTADLDPAVERAKQFALELAVEQGFTPDVMDGLVARGGALTLGEVFDLYRRVRLPRKSAGTQSQMDISMRHFETLWGRDLPVRDIDQEKVDAFADARRRGGYRLRGAAAHTPSSPSAASTTIRYAVKRLNTILRWIRGRRHNGMRILPDNPMEGIELPAMEDEVRQPMADPRRFRLYMEYAPAYETRAARIAKERVRLQPDMLSLLVALARWTGRRRGAIIHLRFRDVLFRTTEVRNALARAGGQHQHDWAEDWPYGAIRWDRTWDKMNRTGVVPMPERLNRMLKAYVSQYYAGDPDAWLFAPTRSTGVPLETKHMSYWIVMLERLIRANGHDLPKMEHGLLHPFRRMWRSERAGTRFDRKLVSICGGWYAKEQEELDGGYLQYLGVAMYLCMEFDPRVHVSADTPVPGVGVPGLAAAVLGAEGLARFHAKARGESESGSSEKR